MSKRTNDTEVSEKELIKELIKELTILLVIVSGIVFGIALGILLKKVGLLLLTKLQTIFILLVTLTIVPILVSIAKVIIAKRNYTLKKAKLEKITIISYIHFSIIGMIIRIIIGIIGIIIGIGLVCLWIDIIRNSSFSLASFLEDNEEVIHILIGLIPILTALIAIWGIGLQIRNKNITEERQKWLTSLKLDVSKFMSILIKNYIRVDNDFDFLYYKIFFNLNKNDELIDSQIINRMNRIKENNRECKIDIEILENDFSDMFKFEWERIKIETGWRSYLPFIGTYFIKNKVRTFKYETATKMISKEI